MSTVDLYLMSPPGPKWRLRGRANFRSSDAFDVDARAAIREWVGLADAIEARGGRVVCLVPDDADAALTGLPYAAECGHVVADPDSGGYRFLLPNMAVPHRTGERALWRRVAEDLHFIPTDLDGKWEAQGDVATFQGRTILFFGGRTDRAGVESAARHFPKDTILIEVRQPAFHGNMALLPLDSVGKILVCPDVLVGDSPAALERAFGKDAIVPITLDEVRVYVTNALPVGRDLLCSHLFPERAAALVDGWGLRRVMLPLVELCEKGGGAARCLVSIARVDPLRVDIPAAHDYRQQRNRILSLAEDNG